MRGVVPPQRARRVAEAAGVPLVAAVEEQPGALEPAPRQNDDPPASLVLPPVEGAEQYALNTVAVLRKDQSGGCCLVHHGDEAGRGEVTPPDPAEVDWIAEAPQDVAAEGV